MHGCIWKSKRECVEWRKRIWRARAVGASAFQFSRELSLGVGPEKEVFTPDPPTQSPVNHPKPPSLPALLIGPFRLILGGGGLLAIEVRGMSSRRSGASMRINSLPLSTLSTPGEPLRRS
jgi:hypothetical protein